MGVDEKIISKIRKVLKLAQDNYGNDEESLNIMAKAQRLMVEYNISMADVEAHTGSQEEQRMPNDTEAQTEYMKSAWWLGRLSRIIADNFRCYVYIYTYDRKRKYVFLGLEDDVAIAKEVFEFAMDIIESYSYLYMRRYTLINKVKLGRTESNAMKNDYISGYLDGMRDKFNEQVEREGWGLMIYNKHAVVEKAYKEFSLKSTRASKVNRGFNSEARQAGYQEGRQFDR
jgi:hypothetical protein